MATIDDDVASWLGSAAHDLTPEQLQRFTTVWESAIGLDNDPQRDEILSATVEYLRGETTAEQAGSRLLAARTQLDHATTAARQIAIMAINDGATESATARAIGVDRMTIRKWLGKS